MKPVDTFRCGAAVFALLACTVLGQQPMPRCASTCLGTSLQAQDDCASTNITCICLDTPLMASISTCVLSSCTVKEALVARNITETMCGNPIRDNTQITPIITGVSGGAATLAVIARCLAVGKAFALDDLFAVIALVSALPMGIIEFFMSIDGFGKDIWTLTPDRIYRIVLYTWLTEIFYFGAVAFTKMSFLLFCLRIFPHQQFRRFVYSMLVICLAYGIAFMLTCIFHCTPVSYIWTNWDGQSKGTCVNFNAFAWAHAVINIVLDLIILAMPIPELLRLSMSTRKKVYIIMMFSVGAFTTIVSIIRLRTLVQFAKSKNPTYDYVSTAYWSVLEAFLGIFCVCMPALRRFLAFLMPSCFGSTQHSGNYQNYDSGGDTPNKISDTPKKESKRSLNSWRKFGFESIITKTVDMTVESRVQPGEDDEVMLVEVNKTKTPQSEATTL